MAPSPPLPSLPQAPGSQPAKGRLLILRLSRYDDYPPPLPPSQIDSKHFKMKISTDVEISKFLVLLVSLETNHLLAIPLAKFLSAGSNARMRFTLDSRKSSDLNLEALSEEGEEKVQVMLADRRGWGARWYRGEKMIYEPVRGGGRGAR